ncbi:bifunctional adenosylcobinamide kinase/adenosylcobinamide-phosphate guanylyltransferase [Methylobacterium oryzae]|uniref:bifunctional adenosylcobinamide kinase/adenosylcobinamide-phosphate guanylyltransferase n=1 Tax=Methylobacterium oryzae TaxID=334852 RepID=UPI003AF63EBB
MRPWPTAPTSGPCAGEPLRGDLQAPPPDPVGDVAILLAEQGLEVAQRHADGRREPGRVDCLTLWLTNLILAEADVAEATARLLAACAGARGPLVLVGNEVGLGIVPDNALARRFRDAAGRLHQQLAVQADRVVLTVAGLPLVVKPQASQTQAPRTGAPA